MQIVSDINIPPCQGVCGLTLGNFDGVHRGHVTLLHHLRSLLPSEASLMLYTFINHPTHVLSHLSAVPFIYTLEHKLKVLSENGVDCTILATFTRELAEIPYDQFLFLLKEKIGFSFLVLGAGARFGKNQEGTEERVRKIAEQLHFHVEYMPKLSLEDSSLSSGRIRTLIAEGQFARAASCLGRPYSIYAPLFLEKERYRMSLWNICLPPTGSYPIYVCLEGKNYMGQAHIDRRFERIYVDFMEPLPLSSTACVEVIFIH